MKAGLVTVLMTNGVRVLDSHFMRNSLSNSLYDQVLIPLVTFIASGCLFSRSSTKY